MVRKRKWDSDAVPGGEGIVGRPSFPPPETFEGMEGIDPRIKD
jgi:hypothetical protein